jgi:hypothetical protein
MIKNSLKQAAKKRKSQKKPLLDTFARAEIFDYYQGICYYCCTQLHWQDFSARWILRHKGHTGIPITVIAPFAPTCLSCDSRIGTRPLRKGFFCKRGHNHGYRHSMTQLRENHFSY